MEREFVLEQNEIREDYQIRKKDSHFKIILRSRSTKGILFLVLFAIVVPVLVYYFIIDKGVYSEDDTDTCSVNKIYQILCGINENVTFDYCTQINCCFDNSTKRCFHYLPSKYYYFNPDNFIYEKSLQKSPFGQTQSTNIMFFVKELDENNLEIILQDSSYPADNTSELSSKNYFYKLDEERLSIEVFRNNSEQDTILTTAKGPLIISKYYWEWTFQLTDEYLFGLGQTLIDLDENSTLTKVIYGNDKDHNTLPIFLAYKNKNYHGLTVRNEGPLEVTVLPSNLVILKSLGEGKIILKLSVGPTIKDVMKQRDEFKEFKGFDLKTLGVHICREGSSVSLSNILTDFDTEMNTEKSFQYDSDCLHENLLLALRLEDKSENIKRLNDLIDEKIVARDKDFSLALPPQVSVDSDLYTNSTDLEIFFMWNQTQEYQSTLFTEKVVYPYFGHSSVSQFIGYWIQELETFFTSWPNYFTLVKNWPSDESVTMNETEDLQYLSDDIMDALSGTLPWNVSSNQTLQFIDHNNYGHQQLQQLKSLLDEANFMTASHNLETAVPINLQNIDISWSNFQKAITTILFNSISGYPLTSIPVCGSTSNFVSAQESLCLRWYLMAATAPLFRISSDLPKRDPDSLYLNFSNFLVNKAKWAISFRYSILNYLFQILENNEPIMRPMFYDFPEDIKTFGLVTQYMVGPNLLVAQPTLPDQTQLNIYLPESVDNWFEFWGGKSYSYDNETDGYLSLFVVEDDFVAFIREGAIIVLDESNLLTIKIALKCETENLCSASGYFKTESNFFEISFNETILEIKKNTSDDSYSLHELQIFKPGVDLQFVKAESDVKLDGNKICTISGDILKC